MRLTQSAHSSRACEAPLRRGSERRAEVAANCFLLFRKLFRRGCIQPEFARPQLLPRPLGIILLLAAHKHWRVTLARCSWSHRPRGFHHQASCGHRHTALALLERRVSQPKLQGFPRDCARVAEQLDFLVEGEDIAFLHHRGHLH